MKLMHTILIDDRDCLDIAQLTESERDCLAELLDSEKQPFTADDDTPNGLARRWQLQCGVIEQIENALKGPDVSTICLLDVQQRLIEEVAYPTELSRTERMTVLIGNLPKHIKNVWLITASYLEAKLMYLRNQDPPPRL